MSSVPTEVPPNGPSAIRHHIGLALGPILFVALLAIPCPLGMTREAKSAAAVAVLMAVWWISEALPIPAVALLPLVLFPALGVMDAKSAARPYAQENVFLFLGGFFIAMAMQRWGLHRRMALLVVRALGTEPRRLILGFMVAGGFISMWISDTATVMMMMPIGLAVIQYTFEDKMVAEVLASRSRGEVNFATALMLGIAYAGVIGGIATLVGTPPNLVFKGQVAELFPDAPPVTFTQWLMMGLPATLLLLPLCWLWLTRVAVPISIKALPGGREVIARELRALGPMNQGEKLTLAVFVATVVAWCTRADLEMGSITIRGWASFLGAGNLVTDSTVAMTAGLLLFLLPAGGKNGGAVLDWSCAPNIPWGVLLLFGGGFALADAFEATKLSGWLGGKLVALQGLPPIAVILGACLLTTFLTELTSNTATASILMPILAATAIAADVHPFLLMVPAAMSASCAFMLPVATPGNAIVFSTGYIDIPRMAKTGLGLNLIGAVVITLIVYYVAVPVFGIAPRGVPAWAR